MSWKFKPNQINRVLPKAIKCLHDWFGDDIYNKKINGFTKMKTDNTIFRSDVNYKGHRSDLTMYWYYGNQKTTTQVMTTAW